MLTRAEPLPQRGPRGGPLPNPAGQRGSPRPAANGGSDRADGACACGGGCQRCKAAAQASPALAGGATIQRTPAPPATPRTTGTLGSMGTMGTTTTAAPSTQDYRDFVQATIDQFNRSASYFGDPLVRFDRARFDTVIDNWYAMVVERQQMIRDRLNGDVLLDRDLQAAYIAALGALIAKAATLFNQTHDTLYGVNSGRIPLWAWQAPHRQEAGFSTPLGPGQGVDPLSGNVGFATATGIGVTILPDATGIADPSHPRSAVTRMQMPFSVPFTSQTAGGVERILTLTPPVPAATIQTFYPPGVSASGPSGYGRGTTREDTAGSRVDARSTSLRWHEGNHGLDFQRLLQANPLPAFTSAVGNTRAQFDAAVAVYTAALQAYFNRANAASSVLTHCVGTTIDQFNRTNAAAGATVTLECGP